MDPLSAVSLAGTVVAFVDFSLKLASRATEICGSENGSSDEEASLETVYATLSKCSANLSTAVGGQATTGSSQLPRSYACIRKLAHACQTDCAAMLKILERLKEARKFEPGDSSIERRAKSIRGALKAIFKDPELKSLESRLQRTQRALTLELCAISSAYHEQHLKSFEELKKTSADYQTHHADQLEKVRSILDNLKQIQSAAKPSLPGGDFQYDDVLGLEQQMSRLSIATHDMAYQQDIIKGLEFKSLHSRQHDIHENHEKTYHWALRKETRQAKCQERLERWISTPTNAGVFWVSGKPGSGKSTFMKYVVHNVAKRIDWNIPRLRSTIESLVSGKAPGVRFCIFVDGLDEFDGDHLDLSQYLLGRSESPLVKLCVSSRPWNVFEDAFGNNPAFKLYMHDLNHGDILAYTRSRLFEHPRWKLLLVQHADACNLVDEITRRSTGVFLWVFLVTRMLREGLTNDDSFVDLRKRLLTFPTDLHNFFRNIIESVDSIYQKRTAGCLQLAKSAIEPLETLIYYFHDVQYDSHAHAPHRYTEIGVLDTDYKKSLKNYTIRRINAYCRGLLEHRNGKVEFLHRTVADFLDTSEMVQLLAETSIVEFDPLLSILDCFTSLLETQRYLKVWFAKNLKLVMAYVRLVENRNDGSSAMSYLLLDKIVGYLPLQTYPVYGKPDFTKLAMELHMFGYIHYRLQKYPAWFDSLDPDVINLSLTLPASSFKERLLDMVFKHQQSRDNVSALPLSRVTKSWTTCISTNTYKNLVDAQKLFQQFLEHGADPNVVLSAGNPRHFPHRTASLELFKCFISIRNPHKAAQKSFLAIMDLLIHHGAQFPEIPIGDQVRTLFVKELQDRHFDRGGERIKPEREFVAEVMERLVLIADWDMSRFWPDIERFLGADLLKSLRETHILAAENRKQSHGVVKTSHSRLTSPEGMTGRKRRRLPSIDTKQGQQKFLLTTQSNQNYCVISDSDDDDDGRKQAVKTTGTGTASDPLSVDDDSD
ncbi:hypothetical protein PG988_001928 [Apiospora saccharicola]